MSKLFFFATLILAPFFLVAQDYSDNWNSLDTRPVPTWFKDAKFGIFIHWGVYSVPAYRPFELDKLGRMKKEGIYAEWYAPDVMYQPGKNDNWHAKTYGAEFGYRDFLPYFRAELFNPDEWANLFKKSGARYVVLTSKHCEGFCLWPSEETYSRGWNAGDAGPERDLLGDLTTSVRDKGMKMGYYYSFLEYWSSPKVSWSNGRAVKTSTYVPDSVFNKWSIPEDSFINRLHFHVKELITNYEPDILWTDAEWDYTEDQLRSKELLAWIYNNAPNRETIAVNDRWAHGTRGQHGGFFTSEYGSGTGDSEPDRYWEECMGIGYSFGYNRAEQLEDYRSSDELIETLVRTVTSGGNLLLNVGPRADGTIPLIMQQRLLEIGSWLEKNGEAIYASRTWMPPLPMRAINPRAGDQVLFTQKGDDLYVFLLDWKIDAVSLKDIGLNKEATAFQVAGDLELDAKVKKGGISITLPEEHDEDLMVIRIENAFAPED